jgi:hypothetical protein
MKRILIVLLVALCAASLAPAQTFNFADFQTSFGNFAGVVAGTLASTATVTGLSWSPAYVGQFPHFGIGLSAGAGLIPFTAIEPILTTLGVTLPSGLDPLKQYGIPLPSAVVDARIGGFGIPFDIGLKVGLLPPSLKSSLGSVNLDYLLAGADLRIDLLKDQGLMPALSVGVGYTYFRGSIGLPGVLPGATTVDIHQFMQLAGYTSSTYDRLVFSSPDLTFNWQSNVIEAKVQLSKQLLLFIPHIGLSAAYGISTAGGGVSSTMDYQNDAGYTTTDLQNAFAAAGYEAPTSQGFVVSKSANGWSVRVYGGLDIALLIIHLDVSGSYNLVTGSLGGGLNLRLQL